MKTSGNTILITGGATGIGYALAEALSKDNKVIICGRRNDKLKDAKEKLPDIETRICDVSDEKDREDLFLWITSNYPDINILINNAGIQNAVDLKESKSDRQPQEDEIDINLKAPIRLCEMFIPYFMGKKSDPAAVSAIINVSSGLGFVPLSFIPIYCATKAALHSFTMSIRHQLKDTNIKVFEIIPPIVDTELDRGRRPPEMRGIQAREIVAPVINALKDDIYEIPVERAEGLRNAAIGPHFNENFDRMNH